MADFADYMAMPKCVVSTTLTEDHLVSNWGETTILRTLDEVAEPLAAAVSTTAHPALHGRSPTSVRTPLTSASRTVCRGSLPGRERTGSPRTQGGLQLSRPGEDHPEPFDASVAAEHEPGEVRRADVAGTVVGDVHLPDDDVPARHHMAYVLTYAALQVVAHDRDGVHPLARPAQPAHHLRLGRPQLGDLPGQASRIPGPQRRHRLVPARLRHRGRITLRLRGGRRQVPRHVRPGMAEPAAHDGPSMAD